MAFSQNVREGILSFSRSALGVTKAIFAVNGVTLLSVLQGLSQLNLVMPDDMGVCGYDDWGWAALIPPPNGLVCRIFGTQMSFDG